MDAETAGRFFSDPKLLAAWSALKESVDSMYNDPAPEIIFERMNKRIEIEKQMDHLVNAQRVYSKLGM